MDFPRCQLDGNMKLNKLLFFAQLISLSKNQKLLFPEEIYAFRNGPVVETVRSDYRNNDINKTVKDAQKVDLSDQKEELEVLKLAVDIFGHLSAQELSELTHTLPEWKSCYENGKCSNGFNDKDASIMNEETLRKAADIMSEVIEIHEASDKSLKRETVNGATFFYDPTAIDIEDAELQRVLFDNDWKEGTFTIRYDKKLGYIIW